MSNRSRSQNGRRSRKNLLSQREYADILSVTPGYVSKRTTDDNRLIEGRFDPFHDARFEDGDPENGDLLGYTDPTDRSTSQGSTSNGQASAEKARKAAGVFSEGSSGSAHGAGTPENGHARENPSGQDPSAVQPQSSGTPGRPDGLEEALENAGDVAGRQAARNPSILRGLLRLAAPALGAVLSARLLERRPVPVALGAAVGFGIAEYSIRAEETLSAKQTPLVPLRPAGLRTPSRHSHFSPSTVRLSN
ncbi:hypothetical protein GGQ18_003249 [Salinibacter ruber]|jgi:hypothetical protein|uniref:hypothetical protein n=1 Tax=Salinibacter ruber TaxID=146919 RepID=UPI00160E1952|nr:hypothetical protein [Salinibacter ruber]MBB4070633.1 hypothetical protein [Salinibacter ruber]